MSEKKPANRSDHVAPEEKQAVDASISKPSHDEIARLAHAIWEARGRGDEGALDDWLGAERLLLKQSSKGHAA